MFFRFSIFNVVFHSSTSLKYKAKQKPFSDFVGNKKNPWTKLTHTFAVIPLELCILLELMLVFFPVLQEVFVLAMLLVLMLLMLMLLLMLILSLISNLQFPISLLGATIGILSGPSPPLLSLTALDQRKSCKGKEISHCRTAQNENIIFLFLYILPNKRKLNPDIQ